MRQPTPWLLLLGLVAVLRLPYLWMPVQGDDAFYLAMAQHALVDPVHPNNFKLIAQGGEVDMRGFPKPPGNAWILAAALAVAGEVREPALHLLYAGFTLLALRALWELALVFAPAAPRWAVLLFAAAPALVINGNSLEADVPFVAFFLAALAFWVRGVWTLGAVAASVAAIIEYKAAMVVPIAGLYLWRQRPRVPRSAWLALAAPVAALAAWQLFQRWSTGAAPAEVLAGYFQTRGLQSPANKLRNALALTVHSGWVVSPLLTLAWFGRAEWALGALAALAGAWLLDANPLFWLPLGAGVGVLTSMVREAVRRDYLAAWFVLYFSFAVTVFFAGSARYLLPAAAPLVLVTVNRLADRPRWLTAGFVLQMALALLLNQANYEHWLGYREAVARWDQTLRDAPRAWVAGEWGLRFYAEAAGAASLRRDQTLRPGDVTIAQRIGQPIDFTPGGGVAAPLAEYSVQPRLPLRLLAAGSRSAYSSHDGGFRAFDVSAAPADVVTASVITARAPVLSYLPMNAPEAEFQLAGGAYALQDSWRWTNRRVVALLKTPAGAPKAVEATFRIIDHSPVRRATLLVDGRPVAEASLPGPGLHTLKSQSPVSVSGNSATLTLLLDSTFRVPNDDRELAVILTGIGFTR
ncbi:MAG: glycosyltransferase family 39 protein [Acidobacteria bacterium]|nr:glycosyltransferase family 39 protein [Acidobacteriota bacterium]